MLNGVGPYRKTTLHYHFDLEEWPWTTAYTMTHTISQISHSRVIRVSLSVSPSPTMAFEHSTIWGYEKVTKQEDSVLYVSIVIKGKWQLMDIKKTAGVLDSR